MAKNKTYYYFIDGSQSVFERQDAVDVTVYPMYKELTADQVAYHKEHPEATRYEIEHKDDPPYVPTLDEVKAQKIAELEAYDSSPAVNEFYIGNASLWLDKATRVGLMLSFTAQKEAGATVVDLWYGSLKFTLPLDATVQMLGALEIYASKCFNATAQHRLNILNLETKEEVEAYDFKTGYPEKLSFEQP